MLHAILLCCAMLADDGKPTSTTATDRAAYEAAAAKAGKDSGAHVKLALWCEAHDLSAERIKHLSIAASLDPSNILARGLLGLMAYQGKWARPDQVEKQIHDDRTLQALIHEYLDRRVRTPPKNVDAQLRLAAWCLENGLKDEAMAHYHLVTGLDPSRDIAWLRLGYKKYKDRWFKPDDLAAQKFDAERQKRADTQWKPRLEKLRDGLGSTLETRRLKAEKEAYRITDPGAAPMIWKVFGNGSEPMQIVAVELLSQIEGPTASFWLAAMALKKPAAVVRERAARALQHRDPRDVIGWLVNLVHKPFKYEVKPGTGPGSTATLLIDGELFNRQRLYRFPDVDVRVIPITVIAIWSINLHIPPPSFRQMAHVDFVNAALAACLYSNALEETEQRREPIEKRIEDDIRAVEEVNAQIKETNDRSLALLESLTGEKFGSEPAAWQKRWAEELGLSFDDRYSENKPTFTEAVAEPEVAVYLPLTSVNIMRVSCFAAGTMVQTIDGPRKIESVALGDRVLSQHTSTGAISFHPVLATTVRSGAETFRIRIDGETIVATGIHRFWKAGAGWTMARDLKPGDHLRKVDGVATVQSIVPDAIQNVYNLSVAENRDFFVGKAGALVHDVSFVQPVSEPFDRQTKLFPTSPR